MGAQPHRRSRNRNTAAAAPLWLQQQHRRSRSNSTAAIAQIDK
jgi:hypothetical protein